MYLILNKDTKQIKIVNSVDGLVFKKGDNVEVHGDKQRGLVMSKSAGVSMSSPITDLDIQNATQAIII